MAKKCHKNRCCVVPRHDAAQNFGFVFNECRFTCEERVEDGSVFLVRPWRDHGKCSFISCGYGRHISKKGFDSPDDSGRDKTARFPEYGNIPDGRVLTEEEKQALLGAFGK